MTKIIIDGKEVEVTFTTLAEGEMRCPPEFYEELTKDENDEFNRRFQAFSDKMNKDIEQASIGKLEKIKNNEQ